MKTSFLSFLLLGAALVAAPLAFADDASTGALSAPAAPTTGAAETGTDGAQGQKMEKLKLLLDQLNLTDAQKAQIKQIKDTVPKGKERRQAMIAVLTPDQKAKLMQLFQARMAERQANGGTATAPAAN